MIAQHGLHLEALNQLPHACRVRAFGKKVTGKNDTISPSCLHHRAELSRTPVDIPDDQGTHGNQAGDEA